MKNRDNASQTKAKVEQDILEVFAELEKAYPQFARDKSEAINKLDLWVRYIGWKFSKATMMKAVAASIQESRFVPAVSDIYQLCKRFAGPGDRAGAAVKDSSQISQEDYANQIANSGTVLVRQRIEGVDVLTPKRKEDCIKVNGNYVPKIEFAMDRLTPQVVTDAIHEAVSSELNEYERRSPMALAMKIAVNKSLAAKVKKTINDLVAIATEPVRV